MKENKYISGILDYIRCSPTAFHAASNAQQILEKSNYVQLFETDPWNPLPEGRYFVTRNDSSLIAFNWNPASECKLNMAGAHLDSPGLKIKPKPVIDKHKCLQLGVEVYGGALLAPWFDRDLSIAGRVCFYDKNKKLRTALVDFKKPVGIIPSLAIHLDREANKGHEINRQTELVPIVGLTDGFTDGFYTKLQQQLLLQHSELSDVEIIDHELFFYEAAPPCLTGFEEEFLTGSRLDNLLSCFACVQGIISAADAENAMIILNDHEEVGSVSTTGAQGSFLQDILAKLYTTQEECQRVLQNSFFISADNAHAIHPNYSDKHDPQHLPLMNDGLVIKYNANQRYATNAKTAARFRLLCSFVDVPVQEFVMRSDMACGSTIGPLTAAATGVDTVDIGIPTLAMHSIRETAACSDCFSLFRVLQTFFSSEKNV